MMPPRRVTRRRRVAAALLRKIAREGRTWLPTKNKKMPFSSPFDRRLHRSKRLKKSAIF
jgi:hypothetical protein